MEVKEAFEDTSRALKGDRRRTYEVFYAFYGMDQKSILMHPNRQLTASDVSRLKAVAADMVRGKPLAYAVNQGYFYGECFYVDERVLIPRYDTERSVDCIRRKVANPKRILEIGTGSGCVAITLGRLYPEAQVTAVDISPGALEVAEINRERFDVRNVSFLLSDLFSQVAGTYDLIYSNPPYITEDEMDELDESVIDFEPRLALYGGKDGLDFYRRIICEAPRYLHVGGYIVFEIGAKQKADVENLLREGHFAQVGCEKDFGGLDRVIYGRLENV
ncbi:MAG: peptide chain release factor N(5)-glutamine methyltransferase [Peptoniphilus sp.]|nr:peptide chain release factor N(5)-glutamine methyltransferase [Peptoniphilus sp.]MDY3119168.1 peptide chain release factor N(5)-glutamine methyltransferase [Peptoniphilus sp.]